jgi:sigma-B regulation protein RsbU (phosphoserine phosphatase)
MKISAHPPDMLPWKDPVQAPIPQIQDGDLGAVYYGQRRCGDFYDFVRCSPERLLFGLFDVAGGLEQARPVMVAMQKKLRHLATKLLADHAGNEMEAMVELWIGLNREVMKVGGGVHPCAAFIGCYNEHPKTVSYVNAGHTPGLLRGQDQVSEIGATALPLGLFSHAVPDAGMVVLQPGQAFLLLSRGIVEARRRGEEFGLERAKQYLQEIGFASAHETCVGLLARVRHFLGTAPTHNDVTALSLVRSR